MPKTIKDGTVLTADRIWKADVKTESKQTAGIGAGLRGGAYVDAEGAQVTPDRIDPHTRLKMPFMGTTAARTFESGISAAAAGGANMLVDFCLPGADTVVWKPAIHKTITATAHKPVLNYDVFQGFAVKAQTLDTISRGQAIRARGRNSRPQPGHGRFVPRPPFPEPDAALAECKEINSPGKVERDPMNIPAGI